MKLLSVIIPLYNSAPWLPKCLDSVLNQDVSEEDLEIICINDGSPDDSEQIAKRYQSDHPDSIVVLSQENQGPSGARNNGMRHASGKYLCFVDPDDFVEPNVFGGLVRQMEQQRLDMLRFNYQIVDEEYKPISKREFELRFDYSPCMMSGVEFLANRLDVACNIWRYFYRTELITSNQIWCFTGDYFDDTPWLPLVLMKTERIAVCNTVVYNYQERSDSLVKTQAQATVRRKNNGFLVLLKLLKEEKRVLEGGKACYPNMKCLEGISVVPELLERIKLWYDMMTAHSVVFLLTSVAVDDYTNRSVVLKELSALKVFPLSSYRAETKAVRKIRLANLSPRMFCYFVHLKNR